MSGTDPFAACDRLTGLFERAVPLQDEGRGSADDSVRVPTLAFAIALLRMRVRPALEPGWDASDPIQVALFGGTNTGKSTVLNLLVGRDVAGMGARARLSQHAEAYRPSSLGDRWLDGCATRFRGYRRYRDEHPPRQGDDELRRDGYRPALAVLDPERVATPPLAPAASEAAIFWDAPDFSTEEAGTYLGSVLDLLALADLVVMTVTDESYADARGNALLRMVSETGVGTLIVANKLPDNTALLEDVGRTLGAEGGSRAPLIRLPEVGGSSPADRFGRLLGTGEARALREAVRREASRGPEIKRQALKGTLGFIERHFDELLRPLAEEASLAEDWGCTVARVTREAVLDPYRRDYLEGVRYGEFNRILVHLMELLQVPWIGPLLDVCGRVMRAPSRLLGRGVRRLVGRPGREPSLPPEQDVLRRAIGAWLAALKAEAQVEARRGGHPARAEVVSRLEDAAFRNALVARFDAAFAAYREEVDRAVRRRAERLYDKLKENPVRLATLRGANLLAGVGSVALVIKTGGLDWSDAVVGPVVAGLWQNLVEWGLGRYLETLRAELKEEQHRALAATVSAHLEQPVRDLFRGAASAGDLVAARDDFGLIKATAGRIARGAGG